MQLNTGHRAARTTGDPADPDTKYPANRNTDYPTDWDVVLYAEADLQWIRTVSVADGVQVTNHRAAAPRINASLSFMAANILPDWAKTNGWLKEP